MNKNLEYIKKKFEGSFDVKYRELDTLSVGLVTLVFIDNLCSTLFISDYVVKPLKDSKVKCENLDELMGKVIGINLVSYVKEKKDIDDAILHILSGDVLIIVDKFEEMIFCEAKGFVRRGISIPVTESVLKGPREGFNELFVDNVSLIRRKVRNENLKFEPIYVGNKSKSIVCICYIKGLTPEYLIQNVRDAVDDKTLEFLLDTNYIESRLKKKENVFDTIGYTEKPDEIAAKIMEGRVAVMVDGSPFVITMPYFFLENFHMADDYYINRIFANFTRVLRWIAFFVATFLPGLYLAIVTYHFSFIPSLFVFRLAVSRAGVPLPTVLEVLIMMLSFQIIKEAGLRLPGPIGSSMGIVSGLILGEAAVGAGIASRITVMVIALSMICYFLVPKMYGALTIWSIIFVIISSFFGLPGFFAFSMVFLARLGELETGGYSYLFPLGTVEKFKFKDIIFRGNLKKISREVIGYEKKKDRED